MKTFFRQHLIRSYTIVLSLLKTLTKFNFILLASYVCHLINITIFAIEKIFHPIHIDFGQEKETVKKESSL